MNTSRLKSKYPVSQDALNILAKEIDSGKRTPVSTSYNKVKCKNSSPEESGPEILVCFVYKETRGTIMVMKKKNYREKIITKMGNDYLFLKENLANAKKHYEWAMDQLTYIGEPSPILWKNYYKKLIKKYNYIIKEEEFRIKNLKKAKARMEGSVLCELKRTKVGKDDVYYNKELIQVDEMLGVAI